MPRTRATPVGEASDDTADKHYVTALGRGLDILQCFGAQHRMLGTTEIAQMTGLAQPTVWRLCYTLQKAGFLVPATGRADKLQLGAAAVALGGAALAGQEALEIIRPQLQVFADRRQSAVALGRRDGDSIVYLLRCQGNSPLLMNLRVGSRIPLFQSAIGWAWLASESPEERKRLQKELRLQDKKIPRAELAAMQRAVDDFADLGFIYHERPQYQINTVAATIELPGDERYLVSCGGPASSLPRELMVEAVGPELVALAHSLQPILLMGRHV